MFRCKICKYLYDLPFNQITLCLINCVVELNGNGFYVFVIIQLQKLFLQTEHFDGIEVIKCCLTEESSLIFIDANTAAKYLNTYDTATVYILFACLARIASHLLWSPTFQSLELY